MKSKRSVDVPAGRGLPDVVTKEVSYVDQRHSGAAGRAIQVKPDQSPRGEIRRGMERRPLRARRDANLLQRFFQLFGVTRRRVASFEHGVNLPDKKRGYLDLFWKGKLLVEQKSAQRSLTPARRQALDYFPGLKEHELLLPPNPSAAGKSEGPAALRARLKRWPRLFPMN